MYYTDICYQYMYINLLYIYFYSYITIYAYNTYNNHSTNANISVTELFNLYRNVFRLDRIHIRVHS